MLALALTLAVASQSALDDELARAIDEVASLHLQMQTDDGPKKSAPTRPSPQPTQFTAAGNASTPQGRQIGIGLQLGYPTAVTAKYMLVSDQGVVGALGGLSTFVYDRAALSLHAAYVFHPSILTTGDAFALTWYIGGGGNIIIHESQFVVPAIPGARYYFARTNVWLGAVMPIGVNLAMSQQPFEVFVEAMPSLLVFPGLFFGLGASLGARFYL